MFNYNVPPSKLVYMLQTGNSTVLSPADSTTYYIGGGFNYGAQTSATVVPMRIPMGGTLVYADITVITGAQGSAQTASAYVRINDTIDALISSSVSFTQVTNQPYYNDALNQAVAAGDVFVIKIVMPAFTTNPTGVRMYSTIMIRV